MNAITTLNCCISDPLIKSPAHSVERLHFFSKFLKNIPVFENHFNDTDKCEHREERQIVRTALFKGGDPAAPSGTATLLRLHPSHEAHRGRRPPCG